MEPIQSNQSGIHPRIPWNKGKLVGVEPPLSFVRCSRIQLCRSATNDALRSFRTARRSAATLTVD